MVLPNLTMYTSLAEGSRWVGKMTYVRSGFL